MKKSKNIYLKLFFSTLQLSSFTFGGGYVIVSLLQKKFVEKFKWINEKEMLDIVALSQSSPGAIAINSSILIGYRMAGFWGAICTLCGTILPPLVIITGISFFYEAFRDNEIVSAVLRGMQAGIAAVIVDVVYRMGKRYFIEKDFFSIGLIILAFSLSFFLEINVIFIILGGIALGIGLHLIKKYIFKDTENNIKKDQQCKPEKTPQENQNDNHNTPVLKDKIQSDSEEKDIKPSDSKEKEIKPSNMEEKEIKPSDLEQGKDTKSNTKTQHNKDPKGGKDDLS
ncbi:MAG: chromate transporter [Bacillota bacterium]